MSSTLLCEAGCAYENQHEIDSKFWSRSLRKSEKYDKEFVETWKGDADGILIFTGLFSSTVASFIIETCNSLQRDPSAPRLKQMSGQLRSYFKWHHRFHSIPIPTVSSLTKKNAPQRTPVFELRLQMVAWDGRVGGEGCYVRRILGRRGGYVQELYRIRGRVNAMA